MGELATCDIPWVTDLAGQIICNGVVTTQSVDQILMDQNFVTAETYAAFIPFALLMFTIAFGVKIIRRAIFARG